MNNNLSLLSGLVLFVIAFTVLGTKAFAFNPFLFAILSMLGLLTFQIIVASHMARTGRVRAKGAKKRRSELLPFLYKRKGKKDANFSAV